MNTSNGNRVAFSPGEFAALFGKAQTWGYRQLYSGKVKATTEYGRIMIPASEVERILATAGTYDGIKPKIKVKADFQKLVPQLRGSWQRYLSERRKAAGKIVSEKAAPNTTNSGGRLPWKGKARQAALSRLGGHRGAA